ncbi:hypothetical protein BH10BAC4_BH10BAC4_16360 [soil metagenome]
MKKAIIGIIILTSTLANAQDYIVTTQQDTVRGEVKILTYDILDRVEVEVAGQKKKNHYKCIQIKSAIIKNETYNPVRTDKGYRMMKLVEAGFLSSYLARRESNFLYEVPYLVKKDGNSVEIPGMGFKKTLSNFLSECHTVVEGLEKNHYNRNDIPKILHDFNNCLDKQATATHVTDEMPVVQNSATAALTLLTKRVDASSIETKSDALDILNDLTDKVKKNKAIPDYMLDGLKESLKAPEFQDDLAKVIALLKK